MSRAPPFPTRRRSPSVTNAIPYSSQPSSAPGTSTSTRPLQISRPVNTYPSNSSSYAGPTTAPLGPSRPQRSELRARAEYADLYSIDSIVTSRSDASGSQYRALPNSANPLTNGPPPRQRPARLTSPVSDDGNQTTPTSLTSALSAFKSAGSRRRQTGDDDDYNYQRERELEIEAEKARQQRIRDRAPGIRSKGSTRGGEIDAVLDQVKDGWEFVIDPNFNNVDLALQLLDKSSLGKDMDSFRRTKNMLSKALKGSVDKHYQAFAASLPHHASLLGHLGAAQTEISSARSSLLEAKEALGSKRADLVQLWNRGQTLEEMIKILDQIEHLKSVPDLLETLMSEKRLLQAAILLVRSLKIINKPDMLEIGAVSDLRSYLISQETALREILVDELQSHLYLKSFWCESRWSAYVPNQRTFPKVEFEAEPDIQQREEEPMSPTSPSLRQSRLTRFLNNLSLRPNDPPHDMDDQQPNANTNGTTLIVPSNSTSSANYLSSNLNPEADSFTYMETLLESLAVLGKLGTALDNVAQRLPGEIFSLVETTLGEVEERAEFGRRRSMFSLNGGLGRSEGVYVFNTGASMSGVPTTGMKGPLLKSSSLRLNVLESLAKRVDHEILLDLFWTLYSKLDAVAQGFRVVTEVANRIGSRRDYKDSSGAKPGMLFPLPEMWNHVQTEILRDGKFNRDRIKAVFRFSDTDIKLTNKALRPHEDGLTRVLKDTMPGLAPTAAGDNAQTIISNVTDDRLLGADQHHRLLIRPDAFHVTVLFQPTLSYLQRISEILPSGVESAQASSAVLDEFVLTVYLPQLEEKVSDLFHEAVTGTEAFQPDPMSWRLSEQPLAKASTQLMALINSLCAMLNTSPFHRENYSRLILGVVIQFYQRCSDRFQMLTTLPAAETVAKQDLISSTRNLAALASLHRSVRLKPRPEDATAIVSPTNSNLLRADAILPNMPILPPETDLEHLQLPLSREMALRFQALLKTYDQLSTLILDTIRIDLRCRAIHYLDSAMTDGTYDSNYEAVEPDPHIVDLNTELVQCNEFMMVSLPKKERKYLFSGLGHLMEHKLIANARKLRLPNAFGIKKITRNILALQQSIKTLTDDQQDSEFERAKRYYALFFVSPQEMLDGLRKRQSFSFEEYGTMLNLQCGVDASQGGADAAARATDRNYSLYVIDLHGLEMDRSDASK
ncbi:exocyst complex component sec8 [Flammula alnicola]|nr:exocyst complex component sec8 [Flammula alnicola]